MKLKFIERPPRIFRALYPKAFFRKRIKGRKVVYLTFDDGPVPEITPWVLDTLDIYDIKATFFMVGQNAERYPELLEEVRRRGHRIGNHTMHHLQGSKVTTKRYLLDISRADQILKTPLFRPPHGWLRWRQCLGMRGKYRLVMYDLVTRDYSWRLTSSDVFENVRRLVRDGSVIVFHDSVKSWPRLHDSLPASIEWLREQGYEFEPIPLPDSEHK